MGEHEDSPSKKFCLTVPKTLLTESFSNSIIPISKKARDKRGRAGFTILRPSYFVSQYGNIS